MFVAVQVQCCFIHKFVCREHGPEKAQTMFAHTFAGADATLHQIPSHSLLTLSSSLAVLRLQGQGQPSSFTTHSILIHSLLNPHSILTCSAQGRAARVGAVRVVMQRVWMRKAMGNGDCCSSSSTRRMSKGMIRSARELRYARDAADTSDVIGAFDV